MHVDCYPLRLEVVTSLPSQGQRSRGSCFVLLASMVLSRFVLLCFLGEDRIPQRLYALVRAFFGDGDQGNLGVQQRVR